MQSTPPPPNPSGSNYRETFAYLCSMLPKPPDDTPDVRAVRNMGAMDAVAALNPCDAFEARLAARIVAMDAHAADALRSASLAVNDPAAMHRCRAQAASMSRQSDAALRTLLRMQAMREKQMAEIHPAAMERAGYWFQMWSANSAASAGHSRRNLQCSPDSGSAGDAASGSTAAKPDAGAVRHTDGAHGRPGAER
jgi:hypothetical protein